MPEAERLLALFSDPSIIELVVNGDGSVYAERSGAAMEKAAFQAAPQEVSAFLKALCGESDFGPKRPFADLSASDGSRVHVLAPPIARGGLCVTIRKRPRRRPALDEICAAGALSPGCASFLKFAVEQKRNILVAGGASSGKTTMLNALAAAAGSSERVLVLEDTPELSLPQPQAVYMKTRLRDPAGLADVTLRDLVCNSLRMRPDRVIVGEVRGAEAFDLLQAMNVGQEGVMATLHANSCREALQRLETLVLSSGLDMPLKAVRGSVALAVDIVVFMARLSDGGRRVAQVAELTGIEMDNVLMSDLFRMEARKPAPAGQPFALRPTGAIPRFYEPLRQRGFSPPLEFFRQ